jgi:hypothetical protein
MAAGSEPDRLRCPVLAPPCQPPSGGDMKTRLGASLQRFVRSAAAAGNRRIQPKSIASERSCCAVSGLIFAGLAVGLMAGCSSSSTPTATGPGASYASAKEFFARGHSANYDHALDTLATLSNADPPNDFTDRARVLRAVILSGELEGFKTLAEAYQKGSDKATDSGVKSEYAGLYRDTLRRAGEISLGFTEAAMQLIKGGQLPKGLTLDAPYPVTLTSISTGTIGKIETGARIGNDEEQDAALGAPGLGIAKVLSAVVGSDQDAVKSKMNSGPVPLDRAKFGLFLTDELATSATLFDRKHIYDPGKYKQLAGIAQGAGQATTLALNESPDPDTEKNLKKLQDQIKAGLKAAQAPAD